MQNLILVISSIVRTIDYIDAYMLTRLRLSALIWMGLVGAGLILICWRMVARHSLAWLANAVLASTFLVLFGVSIIDLGSVAAQWNVRHSREVGGVGEPLDLGYLRQLGPSSLVALATLEVQPLSPAFRERVSFIRRDIQGSMEQAQRTRFGWTSRTARRLNAARSILQGTSPVIIRKGTRTWDGSLILPPIRPGPPAFTIPFVTPKLPHGQRSGL
jgi:hypothetical protein